MVRPVAGEEMASRCAVVMRGGRKPLVVLTRSSTAFVLGYCNDVPTH